VTEPHELTLAQAAEAIRQRALSSVEYTEALLRRIEALDPKFQAWATLAPERALNAARRADNTPARGPLHGVPYGAKDIFDTAGIRTAAGSKVWADRVPDADAAPIVRADAAGGVLVGKTHTTEFADGDPAPCFNPWDAEATPGGSSTGSGVAVAARMVPWAYGSQTVGSVLRPAAYNGVVGLKPTFGRITRLGVIPMSRSCDHVGFLCRDVTDGALLLGAVAGYDPADPDCVPVPVDDYAAAIEQGGAAPRYGLVRSWFFAESDAETRLAMEQVAQALIAAGAVVEEVDPGIDFDAAFAHHKVIQEAEMAIWHEPLYRGNEALYGPKISVYLENGFKHTGMRYAQAVGYRADMRWLADQALARYDVLLTPTASGPAPRDRTITGDTRFQSAWSYTGLPSISIPVGLSGQGLPLGAQMAAPPFQEARLLRAARFAERVLDVHLAPPV
jgi:aspartyl-tRNA(Asn)/glutamyl-tRNA(Gln) amidotransferase subunit A